MQPSYPDIRRDVRVVHSLYGRGTVAQVHRADGQARVEFDGTACPRRVMCRDLVVEPKAMPAVVASEPRLVDRRHFRLVWPIDRAGALDAMAGEGEV